MVTAEAGPIGFKGIYRARKETLNFQGIERAHKRVSTVMPWALYNQGLKGYTDVLLDETSPYTLDETVKFKIQEGKPAYAMDLAGPGRVLREMPVTGGLAVTLADKRFDFEREYDDEHDISTLEGDVLSKSTWTQISEWLQRHNSPGFDLVLCAPIAGFMHFPEDLNLYYYLTQKVWERLNPDEGILYGEVPFNFLREPVRKWALQLWRDEVAQATYNGIGLELRRLPDSPSVLPPLRD